MAAFAADYRKTPTLSRTYTSLTVPLNRSKLPNTMSGGFDPMNVLGKLLGSPGMELPMSMTRGDADDLPQIDVLPLEFHGCGTGKDKDGNPVYSFVLQPQGLDPRKLGPVHLVQVLMSEAQVEQAIAGLTSVRDAVRAERRGEQN